MKTSHADWISNIVRYFANSKLTPLIVAASLIAGCFAVLAIPREEEPQISVPMFDIFVAYPGANAEEVEQRIVNLGERKLWEIPGVEYIYSTAHADGALLIVRFKVGENVEDSLIKLYTKVFSNLDFLPAGASQPLIKVRSIDDVPILTITFYSESRDQVSLRKTVAHLQTILNAIPDVSETQITGGRKRQFKVLFDEQKLKNRYLSPIDIAQLIRSANTKTSAGHLLTTPQLEWVEANSFFKSKTDLENLVIGVSAGSEVLLKDVAQVIDGPDEEEHDVNIRFGQAEGEIGKGPFPATTLSISKRKGTNAADLAHEILHQLKSLESTVMPPDVRYEVTRNYGETAKEKSDELLFHMAIAVFGVSLLIALILGVYEAGVVAVAIPMTLAMTLTAFYFWDFTLNRITLFALIFSIGILVDDPIVDVENIVRHLRLPENRGKPLLEVTIEAVNEVRSPLILATLTVICAILPMAFVRGLMGPYMKPIPLGSAAAMVFSMLVAFIATPWAAYHILGSAHRRGRLKEHDEHAKEDFLTRLYYAYMKPLIYNGRVRSIFLLSLAGLLLLSCLLIPLKAVRVKMLPFDNKNEFQVILNMPEGAPIEKTKAVLSEIADYLTTVPEVHDIESYAGTSSPYNFNGLVRHYFLRREPYHGDLQVNLVGKHERKRQSHDIASSVRPKIHEIVSRAGGYVQVAEVPPGPPVLSTLVLEIYGPSLEGQHKLARQIETLLSQTEGVTDLATYEEAEQDLLRFNIDTSKASLNGILVSQIAEVIRTAVEGTTVDLLHLPDEYEPAEIVLRLPPEKRKDAEAVSGITMLSRFGQPIALKDLIKSEKTKKDFPIYHKNLMRVSYVIADVTGPYESPIYAILKLKGELNQLPLPSESQTGLKQLFTEQPKSSHQWTVKWDGEWQITYEVFRDLGIAFAAVLLLIYILVVGWFRSFKTPWIIMLPIPLTLIGILPAHWLTNIFFTATSMIGLIAGAGIVVRNSIILVDFIELRLAEGMPLEEAVIDAGAKRFRPMLLTAMAVVVGAAVILFDPIFQGLALSLMAGEVASTFLSRTAVPVFYYMAMKKQSNPKQERVLS
ncbi:MAG: multidrug transporter AcrB [Candidatus Omnitrophica bacterium CG11_big_fil_rev_8_21_14_0_20_45_26]|uniref:Multidrug transporter AcrB n=1 Tax=Candidatus Abzuiibacterium crystallinum TaxID=1974748 RepID=A0A2H0LSG6_9BACT|nr:MAG: multidrug transporter AcrB [Candidatus Omnitrophica bacterium CG11_big_fil_rev_8_21_14_0_20_45_26]PIW63403.1 MAG: multidrug transporter AcrB [Candidatus Omnitrophica bacterium CG12_big_fil_rev_8_21_14_0_65_45_16]